MKKSIFFITLLFSCNIEFFNPFIDTKTSLQVLSPDIPVTATAISTIQPTVINTPTSSPTAAVTPTLWSTLSPSITATSTPIPSATETPTPTISVSATPTPSITATQTATPSITAAATSTITLTPVSSSTPVPTSSAPLFTPTPPQGYIWCCSEDENITFTEYVDVAYGAEGHYLYKYNQIGLIIFSNEWFEGDPIEFVFKAGFYKAAGSTITPYTTPTPTLTPTPSSS
jgi:hypothetical protein